MPFHQPQQLQCLYHVLPKLSFVLHCRVGDKHTYNGFGAKLKQAGALFTLFSAWNVVKVFEELQMKQSVVIHRDKVTHLLFNQ